MDKFSLVAEYEQKHSIPEQECYVQFIKQYETYMPKMGIAEELLNKRYFFALEEKKIEEKKKEITGVYSVVGRHNLQDQSRYASKNFPIMLESFFKDTFKRKELGVEIDNVYYPLLVLRDGLECPEFQIFEDNEQRNVLINLQKEWFFEWNKLNNQGIIEKTNALMAVSSSLAAKQDKMNYAKEFKKLAKQRKCVVGCRLEEYDFREVDLSDYIFINCNLSLANFSHCNLANTFFVNCDLTDACFYGATLNGCYSISGDSSPVKDPFKLISAYKVKE